MPTQTRPRRKRHKRPTLKDIANELGITTMTVSKSLRGVGRISDEMRRLVHSKAEEIGYLSARDRLFPPFIKSSGSSDYQLKLLCPTIGRIERGATVPYRNDMIVGLDHALSKTDGAVQTGTFSSLEEMQSLLAKEHFHGVILSEPLPSRWIETIGSITPIIYTIGHDFQTRVDSVYFNEARAAATAANRLWNAGHRSIGWLGVLDRNAPFHIPDSEFGIENTADWLSRSAHGTRLASWLYLARQQPGTSVWPVNLFDRDWRTCSLSEAVGRASRTLFQSHPRPTAIVCLSNAIAAELITQLEESGLRVPDDMSIVSYGVEKSGVLEDGRQISGLSMPMDKVGSLVPEVVQRRLAYPEGLSISFQLDADWVEGNTVRSLTHSF
jgi:DNA-binding LacI/PurR family transcriptional regulator